MKILKKHKIFNFPQLTDNQIKEIDALKKKSDRSIDIKSIPELSNEQIATGHLVHMNKNK